MYCPPHFNVFLTESGIASLKDAPVAVSGPHPRLSRADKVQNLNLILKATIRWLVEIGCIGIQVVYKRKVLLNIGRSPITEEIVQ